MLKMANTKFHLLLSTPFIIFLQLTFTLITFSDISSDREALLRLRTAIQGRTMSWNISSPTPCSWPGVTCGLNISRVTELRLPGNGLSGEIPLNTIGNLTELRTLSLRHNLLTGSIPDDIGLCIELRFLYLQDNEFSGELPPGFFQLTNLLRVDLSRNSFSGELSPGFNNFTNLTRLFVENNQFSGQIPELNSQLEVLNVSFNNLTGSIPLNLQRFSSESFLNNSLCGGSLQSCSNDSNKGNKLSSGVIAGIAIGSVTGLVLLILILFFAWKKKYSTGKTRQVPGQNQVSPSPSSPGYKFRSPEPIVVNLTRDDENFDSHSFSSEENTRESDGLVFFNSNRRRKNFTMEGLLRASAEVLGRGNVGTTYRAYMEGGIEVVVKRLKSVSIPERAFRERIEELGKLDHENLIPLVAYFYSREEKLLVYESIATESLEALLHGNRGAERAKLTWTFRLKIASGIAYGIQYLHSLGPNFFHGNIKSSNILLTNYYDVLITEYGITQLTNSTYFSHEQDVYSFGVLLLELLTGKAPTEESEPDLPIWIRSVPKDTWATEVFDPELLRGEYPMEQMVRLLHLALNCTSKDPKKRPLMPQVVQHIIGSF